MNGLNDLSAVKFGLHKTEVVGLKTKISKNKVNKANTVEGATGTSYYVIWLIGLFQELKKWKKTITSRYFNPVSEKVFIRNRKKKLLDSVNTHDN